MLIEGNGIRLEVHSRGTSFEYRVVQQADAVTKKLNLLKLITDEQTGYGLRSNKNPAFKPTLKRFYVRGEKTEKNDKRVIVELASVAEVNEAIAALQRLITKLDQDRTPEAACHNVGKPKAGGTTHVRFALITREMATFLDLTGKKHYPHTRDWPGTWCDQEIPVEPIFTVNSHYNEHIGQAVDVLNKSAQYEIMINAHDNKGIELSNAEGVINHHKVTPEQAHKATQLLKECFDKAYNEGFLVAWWRIVTGVRGPDFTD